MNRLTILIPGGKVMRCLQVNNSKNMEYQKKNVCSINLSHLFLRRFIAE